MLEQTLRDWRSFLVMFALFLAISVLIHELAHSIVFALSGVPFSHQTFAICQNVSPCVIPDWPTMGIPDAINRFGGGYFSATILLAVYTALSMKKLALSSLGGILAVVLWQFTLGTMEGAFNAWYTSPSHSNVRIILYLGSMVTGLLLHLAILSGHRYSAMWNSVVPPANRLLP